MTMHDERVVTELRAIKGLLQELMNLVKRDDTDDPQEKCPKCGGTDLRDASTMGNSGRLICAGERGCGAFLQRAGE